MDPREAKHVAVLLRKAALTEKRAQTFGYVRSGTISVARPCWMLRRGTVSVPCPHAGKSRVEAPLPGVPGVSGGSFSSLTFLGSRVTHEERFAELAEHGAWGAGRVGAGWCCVDQPMELTCEVASRLRATFLFRCSGSFSALV